MHVKITRSLMISVTVFALLSLVIPSSGSDKDHTQKGIAVVNGLVIPKTMLDREILDIQERYDAAGKDLASSKLSEIKTKTLEKLINNELLYQESQRKGIEADNAGVIGKFRLIKSAFSTEDFEQWLNKMSLSEETFKAQIRRKAAIEELVSKTIAQKVTVSDKETKEYYSEHPDHFRQYEQIRASHILIEVNPNADESERKKAFKAIKKIQLELKEGKEGFATLAKKHSQCRNSSAKGGDLGYLIRGLMPEPFEKAAFNLKMGKISDIVETEFGYHLIKVTDKKPETIIPYEDAKKKAGQYLKQEKIQKQLAEHISQLREKAKIKRFSLETAQ